MHAVVWLLTGMFLSQAPLPEPAVLAKEVEAHQRRMDELRENYTFHEATVTDELDANGKTRKSESEDRDVFFVNGYRIAQLIRKDGKELSEADRRSEQERVQKLIERYAKAPRGHSFNRRGENAGIGQILALVTISKPRRLTLNGRSTLAFDFLGDRHAKAHGIAENAARKITGTVWVDESDREVARLQVRFDDNFHIGGGFLLNVQKGTSLFFEQSPLDRGLWMPTVSDIHLAARELLLKGIRQNIHITDSDFRRFDVGVQQQIGAPTRNQ